MDSLSATWTVVYYLAYPFFYIFNLILFVLGVITAPLLHLGHYCLYACWYALHALGKFETLYIFFGIAALAGMVTGTGLHYVSGFIISMLNLQASPEQQTGATLASCRAEKQLRLGAKDTIVKAVQNDEDLQRHKFMLRDDLVNRNTSKQDQGRGGNRFNTILEEEDSSDGF